MVWIALQNRPMEYRAFVFQLLQKDMHLFTWKTGWMHSSSNLKRCWCVDILAIVPCLKVLNCSRMDP